MTSFPIRIDATQIVTRGVFIDRAITPDLLDTRSVLTLSMPPGSYDYLIASALPASFTFSVTAQGTVDYDTSFDAFLSGRGTSTLTVVGLKVTLDARYLSGLGILLPGLHPEGAADFISYKTCHMVPAPNYFVQQGSGQVANFSFDLLPDGTFSFRPEFNGFVSGNGSSTLVFFGYPILVDARAALGAGVTLQPVAGMPFATTSVQYADLLPAQSFALQVNSGVVTRASFSLSTDGIFSIDSDSTSFLGLGTFNHLKLLKVLGPLPV